MRLRSLVLSMMLTLSMTQAVMSQGNPNDITIAPINFGETVSDVISEAYFYDWWEVSLLAGQEIEITMTGRDGLEPLIGLLSPERSLVEQSEAGAANGSVGLRYESEADGTHVIIATRAGNESGTSIGAYTLSLDLVEAAGVDPYREVLFTCQAEEVTNALTFAVQDDPEQTEFIGVTVYGLDGFIPALRTTLAFDFEPFADQFCTPSEGGEGPGWGQGDTLRLPGINEGTVIEENAVKTTFRDANEFGLLRFNLAAWGESTGRYVIVIDGLEIGRNGDRDLIELGLGPLARETTLYVYAVGNPNTRLDTHIDQIDNARTVIASCDDAGLRDCAAVPSIEGFEAVSVEYQRTVSGSRFDAGMALQPGTPDRMLLRISGFEGRTYGEYAIVIIGEFPPRDATDR